MNLSGATLRMMTTFQENFRRRTKRFALDIIRLTRQLPNNPEGWVIGKQLLRSGTSVGANYRAASCVRSKPEFVAKMGIVVEEADETVYWLELLEETNILPYDRLAAILAEANEITKLMSASYQTAKANLAR